MKPLLSASVCLVFMLVFAALAGCAHTSDGKSGLLPNPDKSLDRPSSEFAADAAKRKYETDAPKGGPAVARASYDIGPAHRIDLVNLSDVDWNNIEVWVNKKYVVFVPSMPKGGDSERLDFELFYDQNGHHFDTEGGKNPFQSLEIYRDGKMYTVDAYPD